MTVQSTGETPLITAVVTTYQRPVAAKRAILSVMAQTYPALEILVVEDGSESDLSSWITAQGPKRVCYHRHPVNRGLAAARNTGLSLANGEFIAYLDDDDTWKPQRIEAQVARLNELADSERQSLGVIYSGLEYQQLETGDVLVLLPRNDGNLKAAILKDGIDTLSSTCLFSAAALRDIEGFDESLPSSIDHDIWMALAAGGYEARSVPEPLAVVYDRRDRHTMMGDTPRRIAGVRQFADKWRPTFEAWLGADRGQRYVKRYFAWAISILAAQKLIAGRFGQAWQAITAIFAYCGDPLLAIHMLTRQIGAVVVRSVLPVRASERIFHFRRQLRRAFR